MKFEIGKDIEPDYKGMCITTSPDVKTYKELHDWLIEEEEYYVTQFSAVFAWNIDDLEMEYGDKIKSGEALKESDFDKVQEMLTEGGKKAYKNFMECLKRG